MGLGSCGKQKRRAFARILAVATAAFCSSALFGQASRFDRLTLNVPATSSPYLAGMPSGTKARVGDSAPQQSPVLVPRTLSYAVAVTFAAVGAVEHTPACPPGCYGPNGGEMARHQNGAEHGISDASAPIDSLVGVFLSDEQPDRGAAPPTLDLDESGGAAPNLWLQLKQVFFIGNGRSRSGTPRRYLVPARATRLYLGVMDGYEWNNNSGSFTVTVAIERDQVETTMFAVDSSIEFASWACLPGHARCTPDRPLAEESTPGEFHVILPASSEWSISVPDPSGNAAIHAAKGTVCLSPASCAGPQGLGSAAGPGFLAQANPVGALITKLIDGRMYFSVNHRAGTPFRDHEGYFEFYVSTRH